MPIRRLSSKSDAYRRTLIKIGEFEDFAWFPEVPEHAAAERTAARTGGARAARQMRHMGIIEKP